MNPRSLLNLPLDIFVETTKFSSTATLLAHYSPDILNKEHFWMKRAQILFGINQTQYETILPLAPPKIFANAFQKYLFVITYLGFAEVYSEFMITVEECLERSLLVSSEETIDYFLSKKPQITVWILRSGNESPLYQKYKPILVQRAVSSSLDDEQLISLGFLGYQHPLLNKTPYYIGVSLLQEWNHQPPMYQEIYGIPTAKIVQILKHQVPDPTEHVLSTVSSLTPLFREDPWIAQKRLIYRPTDLSLAMVINDPSAVQTVLNQWKTSQYQTASINYYPSHPVSLDIIQMLINFIKEEKDSVLWRDLVRGSSETDLPAFQMVIDQWPSTIELDRYDVIHITVPYARELIALHNPVETF